MIDKLINIALAEVGYLEKRSADKLDSKTDNAGSKNFTKYARDMMKYNAGIFVNGYPWCDTFVDWCFTQAFGAEQAEKMLFGWSAYTPTSSGYFKQKKQWHTKNPKKGDIIFFKNASGTICHTGIVYKVDTDYVYTVEGNTSSASGVVANGGSVEKKKYALTHSRIAGYGRPEYPKKEEKKVAKSGSDIVNALISKYGIKIDDKERAAKALDDAKYNQQYLSLYWMFYKLVNGNG